MTILLEWVMQLDPVIRGSLMLTAVLLGAWAAFHLTRLVVVRLIHTAARRSISNLDELLRRHRVVEMLSWIAPALVFYHAVALVPPAFLTAFERMSQIYLTLVLIVLISRLLSASLDFYERMPLSQKHPIKGYVQLVKLFVYLFGTIVLFTTLIGVSPWGLLSGLGALMALLLLIFRDTILSFLASLQIATNDLVRVGDWIEAPQFGADGDVIDIALHNIRVQNWDRTIVMIPTYKLLENSFKNWRGMVQSGGRRIKRAIWLDINSFRLLEDEEIVRLKEVELLRDYLAQKDQEIAAHQKQSPTAFKHPLNSRRLSNIGTFRAYASAYLEHHQKLHKGLTMMVRHFSIGSEGLGLEIYCFTSDIAWVNYEGIQADIFDHLLVALKSFDLRVFQKPSGTDLFVALGGRSAPKE